MPGDVDQIRSVSDGVAYMAPTGTTLPTTATAAPGTGFVALGYISEDGLTEAYGVEYAEIKDISGTVVRRSRTSFDATFALTFLQSSPAVQELYYGAAPVSGALEVVPFSPARHAFVFDVLDGDRVTRYVVPEGEVTERGDRSHKAGEASGYEVTITAYPDSAGTAVYVYEDAA